MTPAQRQTYHRQFLRFHRQQERIAMRLVLARLSGIANSLVRILETSGLAHTSANLGFLVSANAHSAMLQAVYTQVGVSAAQREYTRLLPQKSHAMALQTKDRDVPDVIPKPSPQGGIQVSFHSDLWRARMIQLARSTETASRISKLAEKTRQLVRDVLTEGATSNWSIAKLSRQIRSVVADKVRAGLIARTETTRAASAGTELGAQSTLLKLDKVWIATADARTRDAHLAMLSSKPVPKDGLFNVGGTLMKYPGDPAGGAENVCNCFLPDELTFVNKNIIKKAFRAWYEGDIVTIKTSAERSFTCTPNHPILTTDGWVKAGELTDSHKLVKSDAIKLMLFSDFDVNDNPSTFKELFDAFAKNSRCVRVAGVDVNFYGDVPTGDVDIVCVKSELGGGVKAVLNQMINRLSLKGAHDTKRFLFVRSLLDGSLFKKLGWKISDGFIGFCNNLSLFFNSSILKPHVIGLANIPAFHFSISQNAANSRTANVMSFSQSKFTNTAFVLKDNLGIWKNYLRFFTHIFTGINAVLFKNLPDGHSANAELFAELINANAGFIPTDNVVNIKIIPDYSGHVYTFETYNQIYDINTYISRNCRCTVAYIPAKNNDN